LQALFYGSGSVINNFGPATLTLGFNNMQEGRTFCDGNLDGKDDNFGLEPRGHRDGQSRVAENHPLHQRDHILDSCVSDPDPVGSRIIFRIRIRNKIID